MRAPKLSYNQKVLLTLAVWIFYLAVCVGASYFATSPR